MNARTCSGKADERATAFRMGWHDGRHGIGAATMREALNLFGRSIGERGLGWGDELCSLYLNGRGDGERGDTSRL